MVLFYCTAVAMKRQDQTGIADGLEDVFDPAEHEVIEYSGYVIFGTGTEPHSNET
jgi:hypothetical protein